MLTFLDLGIIITIVITSLKKSAKNTHLKKSLFKMFL